MADRTRVTSFIGGTKELEIIGQNALAHFSEHRSASLSHDGDELVEPQELSPQE
jgi:hypothetical protein